VNTAYGVEVIQNAFYSVDTFFFMSGMLVAYLSFIELDKKRFNLPMFYLMRYIRLVISSICA
jgi:peptidoglycan/LPS O-acetylase OafA/YrhL